jgi:hypothetical protein
MNHYNEDWFNDFHAQYPQHNKTLWIGDSEGLRSLVEK